MLELVQSVAGVSKPVRHAPERVRPENSEVRALICDYSKANAAFGYAPALHFEVGVERLRDHLLEYRSGDPSRYHI
jgi:nucleoside-diphosphate-sugar epimerase